MERGKVEDLFTRTVKGVGSFLYIILITSALFLITLGFASAIQLVFGG